MTRAVIRHCVRTVVLVHLRRASIAAYVSTAIAAIIARVSTIRWLEITIDIFIVREVATKTSNAYNFILKCTVLLLLRAYNLQGVAAQMTAKSRPILPHTTCCCHRTKYMRCLSPIFLLAFLCSFSLLPFLALLDSLNHYVEEYRLRYYSIVTFTYF